MYVPKCEAIVSVYVVRSFEGSLVPKCEAVTVVFILAGILRKI